MSAGLSTTKRQFDYKIEKRGAPLGSFRPHVDGRHVIKFRPPPRQLPAFVDRVESHRIDSVHLPYCARRETVEAGTILVFCVSRPSLRYIHWAAVALGAFILRL